MLENRNDAFYGVYPSTANYGYAIFTIPCVFASLKSVKLSGVYVYTDQSYSQISNATINSTGIDKITVIIPYEKQYAGKSIKISYALSN